MKPVSFSHLLLVCCLLLMQLGGMTHAFSHAFSHLHQPEAHHQEDELPEPESFCADCLAFADISAVLPAQPTACGASFLACTPVALEALTHSPIQVGAYRSRAPPRLAH